MPPQIRNFLPGRQTQNPVGPQVEIKFRVDQNNSQVVVSASPCQVLYCRVQIDTGVAGFTLFPGLFDRATADMTGTGDNAITGDISNGSSDPSLSEVPRLGGPPMTIGGQLWIEEINPNPEGYGIGFNSGVVLAFSQFPNIFAVQEGLPAPTTAVVLMKLRETNCDYPGALGRYK